jgi:hypothetical protein
MKVALVSVICFLSDFSFSSESLEVKVERKSDSEPSVPGNGRSPRVWDPARDRGESIGNQFGRQTRQSIDFQNN